MKKLSVILSVISISAFFAACGGSEEKNEAGASDSTATVQDSGMVSDKSEEYFMVPAPDEMFSFIKDIGGEGKSTAFLNPPDNYKNYLDNKSKALNFGIYATDFLYSSIFDYGSEALKYFVNVKKLGDELGISGTINEATADRIKKNIGNNDSLSSISNALYFSAIEDLEKTDKASTVSLVITGGWIESLHLVTNMVKKFNADNPAVERISEQKYTLENLIGYLKKYESDANVAAVTVQMNELKSVFDQLKEETTTGKVAAKNGKKVLGGGTKITITEEQFNAIKDKVKSIHDSFTMPK